MAKLICLMKNLPKIPDNVGANISHWVSGSGISKIREDKSAIQEIQKFYQSLNIDHKSNAAHYRGLKVSTKGFIEFLKTNKLKLKEFNVESWTCDKNMAYKFAAKGGSGIVLAKKIPSNSVIINFKRLYDHYEDEYNLARKTRNYDDLGSYGFHALNSINHYLAECEILTKTLCTNCKLDEIIGIMFVVSYRSIEFVLSFMETLKLGRDASEFLEQYKSGYLDTEIPYYVVLYRHKSGWGLVSHKFRYLIPI